MNMHIREHKKRHGQIASAMACHWICTPLGESRSERLAQEPKHSVETLQAVFQRLAEYGPQRIHLRIYEFCLSFC